MNAEEFETAFRSRTLAYAADFPRATSPVAVAVGPEAHTRAGHTILVVLANLLARAHGDVVFVGRRPRELLCPGVFGEADLESATTGLMEAINPFGSFRWQRAMPDRALIALGVGRSDQVELAIGCDGWLAHLGAGTRVLERGAASHGAILAAVLGANAAFQRALGRTDLPLGTFSAWDHLRPTRLQGPELGGRLDLGRVLQVGAGAVGAALDYFVILTTGIAGLWTIVDGDAVDASNLNRQLLYVAADAGFPQPPAANKAERAAALLGPNAAHSGRWWGDDEAFVNANYDAILALANERDVRAFLQGRQPTVLLHSTTSPNWEAQFHRHVAGRDDCINCRIPAALPAFTCATEEVVSQAGKSSDAAVPALSAAAALMLNVALVRLATGELVNESLNFTSVSLAGPIPGMPQRLRWRCRDTCSSRVDPALRAVIDGHSRYRYLDPSSV